MISKDKLQLRINLRKNMLELAYKSNSHYPHIGSCLSCIDIIIQTMIFEMKEKEKFILSKGHASLALYVVLNYLKKIPNNQLATYFKDDTQFGVHTPSTLPKYIPLATGSLGHGLSFATGLAKAYKLQNKNPTPRVFCLLSDGECNEGAIWEAELFASQHKLNNLIVLIDKNGFQATGRTSEVLGDAASVAKWSAFGFYVQSVDGHSLLEIDRAVQKTKKNKLKPSVIICQTLRGKGVMLIENKLTSNYLHLTPEIYKKALEDVEDLT